ncbi:holin, partial [Bacillus thuringiensis]|nr:holin [Bacillus thuringiensis]
TAVNAINLIPDPTTPNLSDSERVLNKTSVKD